MSRSRHHDAHRHRSEADLTLLNPYLSGLRQHSRSRSPDPHKQGESDFTPRTFASINNRSLDRSRQSRRLRSSVLLSAQIAAAEALGFPVFSRVENLLRAACKIPIGMAFLRLPSIATENSVPSFVSRRSAISRLNAAPSADSRNLPARPCLQHPPYHAHRRTRFRHLRILPADYTNVTSYGFGLADEKWIVNYIDEFDSTVVYHRPEHVICCPLM